MMREMKEEEKAMSPMFPRLHVNDTEKGGPRPPPRNKMALYEQLSIPSQRFSPGSAPVLPLPPSDGSSLVPSTSPTHIGGRRRLMLTSFCKSPSSSHGTEKLTSYSSTVAKFNNIAKDETKSSNLIITRPLSSDYMCNKNEENNVSNLRNFSLEKTRDEDESRVPIFAQTPSQPHLTAACFIDLKSRKMETSQAEGNVKLKPTPTNPYAAEKSAFVPSPRIKPLLDASSSPSKLENSERIQRLAESSGGESQRKFDDISNRVHNVNGWLDSESAASQDILAFKSEKLVGPCKDAGEKNASVVRGKSCLIPPLKDDKRNSLRNGSDPKEDKNYDSVDPEHSVTFIMNSASANIVSPDDVVGVIGEKQFWDARKEIINQQRIFSGQVFDLHRVIKVQRLIAESSDLLLEDGLSMKKSVVKTPAVKKLPTERAIEPLSLSSMHKFHRRDPISLPSCKNDALKVNVTKQSVNDLHSRSRPQASMATNARPEPWCFNPLSASQWLVPIMSPSEGLIYKPLTGPCPPNAGFMAPSYGIPRPWNMNCGNGDFLNAAYGGVPADKQGFGIPPRTPPLNHAYFPPYGLSATHQSVSCSAVDQTGPCAKTRSNEPDNQASVCEINNYTVQHQNSHNMSSQMSRVMTCQARKVQALKGSEFQGSTGSNPVERGNGDELPLFPMAPTLEKSDRNTETSENRSRVIKVVPHNPRTATESAARIFQLIQEERKQLQETTCYQCS